MSLGVPAPLTAAEVHAYAYENPRPDLVGLIPRDARRILDLGCASGAVGAAVKARQEAEVVGIEIDPEYVERARGRLDAVVPADLEQLTAEGNLSATLGRFDCLIAGDVLEHLRDPLATLRHAASHLEPGGTAIVSLPNVRHWEVLWTIAARGTFPRHDQGIFDRTHLRWFTASDGIALLEAAGLEVETVDRVYAMHTVSGTRDGLARGLARGPLRPFFVLQHILVGRRRGDPREAAEEE